MDELIKEYESLSSKIYEYEEEIQDIEYKISDMEIKKDEIAATLINNFITFIFKDKSFMILNTEQNVTLVKKLCRDKNIDYNCKTDGREFQKYISRYKTDQLEQLLNYLKN